MNAPIDTEPLEAEQTVTIDLNCDVGEGFGQWRLGDDEALLGIATSANIACGFHAGDPRTMRTTCQIAVRNGVAIGAHVGYRDLAGFGRRYLAVEPAELADDVLYQLGALAGIASVCGGSVAYVKPHGALYNTIVTDEDQAAAVVAAVRWYNPDLPVLGLPGSRFLELAEEAGLAAVPEAFADRAYGPDGRLVSRQSPGAVISDPAEVARRTVRMVVDREVVTTAGTVVPIHTRTVCLHGDTPNAVAVGTAVRGALQAANVDLRSFR